MSADLMINVTYNGDEAFKDNFFKIPYNITWEDLEALFKAHFDCDRLSVTYLDHENDEISIGSQDELFEAFRLAMTNKDVLYVKVIPLDEGASIFRMDDSLDRHDGHVDVDKSETKLDKKPEYNGIGDEGFPSPGPNVAIPLPFIDKEPLPDTGPDVAIPLPDVDRESLRVHKSDSEYEDLDKMAEQNQREMEHRIEFHTLLNTRQSSTDTTNDQLSYQEFVTFMVQLKQELRTEIVRDVTKKTVKQVLKGLDGAVIESLQSSQNTVPASLSGTTTGTMAKDTHPVYSHAGVVCDACNNVIIGPRYKCGNCLDFDLCEQCEAKPGLHDPEHVFVKIRIPCTKVGMNSHGHRYPLLKSCIYTGHKTHKTKMVVPIAKEQDSESELNFKLEGKMKDIFQRNIVKRRTERMMAKLKRKEEKLKRRMDQMCESPLKRERLDMLDDDSTVRYDFYKVLMGAQFIYDVSVPDNTKIQSGTKFTKTWRMKNDGDGPWSESTKLKLMWGNIPTPEIEVDVPHLQPGEEGNLSVDFVSPTDPGDYQSHWKLYEHGMQFGSRIWCTIIVVPRETLEPTVPPTESLKVVMDASQRSETGELQEVKVEDLKGESIEITFRPSEEEHLREVAVRREPEIPPSVSDKPDRVIVNVEDVDENEGSVTIDYTEDSGKQDVAKDDGIQEVDKNDGKQEEEVTEDAGKCDVGRQFEHVDVESESRDESSDTCEGFVVYAKHGDTNDLVEVVKQEEQKEKEADQKLEADLTSAVARLTLEGEKREQLPLMSQTATPNNTPFDVTPLKTPNPEPEDDVIDDIVDDIIEEEDEENHNLTDLKRCSNSSSVELVLAPEKEEFQGEHVENYIKTRLASIELKPDIDLESVSSYSDDDDYDDSDLSDSDYFIVPMPECFNISKPFNQSQTLSSYSNSVVDRDFSLDDNHNSILQRSSRAVSVDEILTTSGVIDQRPLSPTQPESQGQPSTMTFRDGVENPDMTESTDTFHEPEAELPAVNEIEAPAVNIVTEQPCGGVSSLPLPVGGEDAVSSPTIDETPGGGADGDGASGAASGENVDSLTLQVGDITLDDTETKEPISASAQMPDNINYVKVKGQKQKQQKSVDFAPEFANQLVATAVNAAGQAFVTAKAVFKTWQDKQQSEKETTKSKNKPILKAWKPASTQYVLPKEEDLTAPKSTWVPEGEDYTPPKSDWKPQEPVWKPRDSNFKPPESNYTPPQSNLTPPESNFAPPKSNWKPPTEPPKVAKKQWTPPPRESGPMGKLFDMGFMDRDLNRKLLNKHNGDVQLVIQDLLSLSLS